MMRAEDAAAGRNPDPLPQGVAMTDGERQALHALAYVYLRHGFPRRALSLLTLLDRDGPEDPAVLRTLAYAWLAVGDGDQALWLISRLQEFSSLVEPPLLLLESRALLQAGRIEDAQRRFRLFLAMSRPGPTEATESGG